LTIALENIIRKNSIVINPFISNRLSIAMDRGRGEMKFGMDYAERRSSTYKKSIERR